MNSFPSLPCFLPAKTEKNPPFEQICCGKTSQGCLQVQASFLPVSSARTTGRGSSVFSNRQAARRYDRTTPCQHLGEDDFPAKLQHELPHSIKNDTDSNCSAQIIILRQMLNDNNEIFVSPWHEFFY